VGILVPACFENPLEKESVRFISDVLSGRRPGTLPLTSVLGAYHILTRYLGVPRLAVKGVLEGLLRTDSPALHSATPRRVASDALDYAAAYSIDSWDGYLVALCRSLGSTIVYSMDRELAKVREVTVVNPYPADKVKEYHRFIRELVERRG
jgi:predicted nucleic acid-binding protein